MFSALSELRDQNNGVVSWHLAEPGEAFSLRRGEKKRKNRQFSFLEGRVLLDRSLGTQVFDMRKDVDYRNSRFRWLSGSRNRMFAFGSFGALSMRKRRITDGVAKRYSQGMGPKT